MQTSFTFDGVDIAEYGLSYVPPNEHTYVWKPTQHNLHEQTIEGKNGGYFFGVTKQPKIFNLRCVFEDSTITDGLVFKIYNDFPIGKRGRLRFSNRNWIYYDCVITNVEDNITNYRNGVMNFQMKAYEAVGHSDYSYIPEDSEYADDMKSNSNFITSNVFDCQELHSITNTQSIYIYNGGMEYAHTKIGIQGTSSNGINIYNKATDAMCKMAPFTTTSAQEVLVDSFSGKTTLKENNQTTPKYLYHNAGFVTLKPNHKRRLEMESVVSGNVLTSDRDIFTSDMVGKILCAGDDCSALILAVSNARTCTIRMFEHVRTPGQLGAFILGVNALGYPENMFDRCDLIDVNEIIISAAETGTMNIDKFSIEFRPTFA